MTTATSIPIDVLGEIFVLCAQEEQAARIERTQRCESCRPVRTGPILGQVCRLWRLTAFSTPSMWRYIHIDLKAVGQAARSARFPMLASRPVEFAQECARRSGVCPLELSFSNVGSSVALGIIRDFISGGMNAINATQSTRIERLEIGLTGASFLPLLSVIQQTDVDLSILKSLSVYHTGYFTVHETIPEDVIFKLQCLPNLRDISFGRIQWYAYPYAYPSGIKLDKVTTLSLDLGHKHEALLMRTLASFPNLVELVLQCTDNIKITDMWEPIPKATLPSLQHISFDPRICHYSLHNLYAPALNKITARQFTRLSPRFLKHLPRATTYSTLRLEQFAPDQDTALEQPEMWTYKSLERLKMEWTSGFTPGVEGFVSCLRNHSEIHNLELADCSLTDDYLSCFIDNSTLLPRLSYLKLSNCPNVSQPLLDRIASYRHSLSIPDHDHDHRFAVEFIRM